MKKVLFSMLVLFFITGCQKEDLSTVNATLDMRGGNKVTICHKDGQGNFHPIQVSENALPAHLNHGDYLPDADGDGYTAIGACTGSGDDCYDQNPRIHPTEGGCCPTGVWEGTIIYNPNYSIPIQVTFSADCNAVVSFIGFPCETGDLTWTLQSYDGVSWHYLEFDPCACSDCDVIVTPNNDGTLDVAYTCYCGGTWSIAGTIYPV